MDHQSFLDVGYCSRGISTETKKTLNKQKQVGVNGMIEREEISGRKGLSVGILPAAKGVRIQ